MSKKLRVLHVVPYFPPDRIGGVGEVAAHLHRGLLQDGNESIVLTSGTSRDDRRVRRIARSPAGFVLKSAMHTDLLRDCDVVHCHHGEAIGLLLANKLRRRVPVLATFHCSCSGIARAHRPYRLEGQWFARDWKARLQSGLIAPVRHLLDRWALQVADRSNFISRHGAVDFLGPQAGSSADVVYYGLPELDTQSRQSSGPVVEPMELLYAGMGGHRKRVYALPYVLSHVRREIPGVRLRIVGFRRNDDPKFARLLDEQNLSDAVTFEGPKRSDELGPYYRAAQVLLVPSAYEGLPMVIIEAFQNGTPTVATNVSGHPEIIEEGVNGYLVHVDDPKQMAQRVTEILKDPAKQHALSQAAPLIVHTRFGFARQTSEYIQLYRALWQKADS